MRSAGQTSSFSSSVKCVRVYVYKKDDGCQDTNLIKVCLELGGDRFALTWFNVATIYDILLVRDHEEGTEGQPDQVQLMHQLLHGVQAVAITDVVHQDNPICPVNQVS